MTLAKRKKIKFKVGVVFRPAPGYEERLHKVLMTLLLSPITNEVSKENRGIKWHEEE
jgi:hypothetical protein